MLAAVFASIIDIMALSKVPSDTTIASFVASTISIIPPLII
jgi:hypothetical protein